MAEEYKHDEPKAEPLSEKIAEKIHGHGDASSSSSSSSESEDEKKKSASSPSPVKSNNSRLFGRERPVHQVLGGGKRRLN